MKQLHPITRIILAFAVLSMIAGYYVPLWEIQLWAPQYPEGLNMKIWLDRLSGAFDIINGLNHYIGMRQIKVEMFPEFHFMGYILGFLIFTGLLPVIIGKRIWLVIFVAVLFIGAGLGIFDFYRWGYDYGHHLDPHAAISVPGMSYDPPLIGYKSLLNFVAYSGPDVGGWILIGAGAVSTALLFFENLIARRKSARLMTRSILLLPILLLLPGCKSEPEALGYGKDNCSDCSMTLTDQHYGCEFITSKGKVFKFDDINCMIGFLHKAPVSGKAFLIDFDHPNHFLKAEDAILLTHDKLRSPMASHIGAFSSRTAADSVNSNLGGGGEIRNWSEITPKP